MLHQEQSGSEDTARRRPSADSSQPETFPRQLDFKFCHISIVFLDSTNILFVNDCKRPASGRAQTAEFSY
jgi:hypothetical protein